MITITYEDTGETVRMEKHFLMGKLKDEMVTRVSQESPNFPEFLHLLSSGCVSFMQEQGIPKSAFLTALSMAIDVLEKMRLEDNVFPND